MSKGFAVLVDLGCGRLARPIPVLGIFIVEGGTTAGWACTLPPTSTTRTAEAVRDKRAAVLAAEQ